MSVGILIVRLVVGLLIAAHGAQKLFGWFGGHCLRGTAEFLESLGFRPGLVNAALTGIAETVGGVLIAAGLLTPLGVAAVVGTMAVAIAVVHLRHGLFAQDGGFEYPLLIAVAAAAIGFTGPGDYSLDTTIGWSLHSATWALGAIGLGLLTAASVGTARWLNTTTEKRRARHDEVPAGRSNSPSLA